jgi:TPR repeat protein
LIVAFGLWASTVARAKVNFSQYGGYEECKLGDDAMRAQHYDEALKWLEIASTYRSVPSGCLNDLGFTYEQLGKGDRALAAYTKSVASGDGNGEYYLAALYEKGNGGVPKDTKQAAGWYRKAGDHASSENVNPDLLNNVAWALATSSEPEVRNPRLALEYALKAVAAEKGRPRPHILDTLAEAYFVNDKYDEAVKTEQKALDSTAPANKSGYLKSLEKYRLALTGSGQTASAK